MRSEWTQMGVLFLAVIPFAAVVWIYGRVAQRVPQRALALWRLGVFFQRWACRYAHVHDLMLEQERIDAREVARLALEKTRPTGMDSMRQWKACSFAHLSRTVVSPLRRGVLGLEEL